MTVQTEVDELCCIALNISTADIEAAVLSHYGNHHAAMKVNAALKCLAASGIMLLICVSWQHCTGTFQHQCHQALINRKTVTQVLQARDICSANPTEGQSGGSYNFGVPPIPEAGEQSHLV